MSPTETEGRSGLASKVLVIGGCYAGLAAALNLLDLCSGRPVRCGGVDAGTELDVQVTVVDERDGYC